MGLAGGGAAGVLPSARERALTAWRTDPAGSGVGLLFYLVAV